MKKATVKTLAIISVTGLAFSILTIDYARSIDLFYVFWNIWTLILGWVFLLGVLAPLHFTDWIRNFDPDGLERSKHFYEFRKFFVIEDW